MAADNDHNFNSINPLHHVEGLSSIADRAVRRKQQQQKQQQSKKKPKRQAGTEAEENLTDEEREKTVEEGHIDFRA